jgi:hypothetical protein
MGSLRAPSRSFLPEKTFAVKANLRDGQLARQAAFHGGHAHTVAASREVLPGRQDLLKLLPGRQDLLKLLPGRQDLLKLLPGRQDLLKLLPGRQGLLRRLMMSFDEPQPLVDAASHLGEQVGRHGVFQFIGFGNRVPRFISKRRQRMRYSVNVSGTIANT